MIEFSQRYQISPGDIDVARFDMTDALSSTETLSTATLTSVGTTGLTVGTASINSGSTYIYGRTVSASRGVSGTVSGQAINKTYTLKLAITTSASRTKNYYAFFDCR